MAGAGRPPPPDPRAAVARELLGECLLTLGRYAAAEPHLLAAHDRLARAKRPPAAELDQCRRQLAELYDRWGKPAEAARWRPELLPPPRAAARR
ncbi:MAG: tetratricopeptide repeat protein [Gemmataceae bacterium]